MKLRYIPNLLSMLRIPFSVALPFLAGRRALAFLLCYAVAGVADVLDGALARRFRWESELGAKFDSIGDGVFIVCVAIAAVLTLGPSLKENGIASYCYGIFAVFAVIKVANLAFTRAKFKQWGFLHLRSARWVVIPLYVLFPVCIHRQTVYNPFVALCLALSVLALLEEIWILSRMERHEYTMSLKSYWEWQRDKRRAAALAIEPKEAQKIEPKEAHKEEVTV